MKIIELNDTYSYGTLYEIFITRAFKCERGKNGAENELLKYLLDYDLGSDFLETSYSKQISKVKKHLTNAINNYLSQKPTEQEFEKLNKLKFEVQIAPDAIILAHLIEDGLKITNRYKLQKNDNFGY